MLFRRKKTIRKGVMTTFVSTNPYDQISLFELAANLIGSPTIPPFAASMPFNDAMISSPAGGASLA
jgi:hypothetical protein